MDKSNHEGQLFINDDLGIRLEIIAKLMGISKNELANLVIEAGLEIVDKFLKVKNKK